MVSLMSYQTLIETFYFIFKPLKPMGFDAKRFAVRLYLTIEYVKTFQLKRQLRFNFNDLSSLLLYSSNKIDKKHSYLEIKEERVNLLSKITIFFMLTMTFCFIFYF
jgi:hypothetical protein